MHLKQHDFENFHLMHTKRSFFEFTSLTEMSLFFSYFSDYYLYIDDVMCIPMSVTLKHKYQICIFSYALCYLCLCIKNVQTR